VRRHREERHHQDADEEKIAMPRKKDPAPRRAARRPKKAEAPVVNYTELDRLLVFGEVVAKGDGTSDVVFPSYRQLAKRFGISSSLVGEYASAHDCMRRRAEAAAKINQQAEEKIIELRASQIAVSREHELRIIDAYLLKFERAVIEDRVRCDDPNDFDKMARLKEFKQGGVESRKEVNGMPRLEDLQERYRRYQEQLASTTPEMTGMVVAAPDATDEAEASHKRHKLN
jgi:hypothetical protein